MFWAPRPKQIAGGGTSTKSMVSGGSSCSGSGACAAARSGRDTACGHDHKKKVDVKRTLERWESSGRRWIKSHFCLDGNPENHRWSAGAHPWCHLASRTGSPKPNPSRKMLSQGTDQVDTWRVINVTKEVRTPTGVLPVVEKAVVKTMAPENARGGVCYCKTVNGRPANDEGAAGSSLQLYLDGRWKLLCGSRLSPPGPDGRGVVSALGAVGLVKLIFAQALRGKFGGSSIEQSGNKQC